MVIDEKRVYNALSCLEKRIELFKSDCALFDNTLETYNLLQQEVRVISELQEELRLIRAHCFLACSSASFVNRFSKALFYKSKTALFDAVNKHRKLNDQLFIL